jgi:hypothetical protein
MASYKFRIGEELSFNDIINAIFNDFFYINEDMNAYDMKSIQLIDMSSSDFKDIVKTYDVSYRFSGNYNKIDLIDSETGEVYLRINQVPVIFPSSHSRWSYEITYCSWDFNPSFKIEDGYYIVIF